MSAEDVKDVLGLAQEGIARYLQDARPPARSTKSYRQASQNTLPNLKAWFEDDDLLRVSPSLRQGLCDVIREGRWEDLVNAFRQRARFGTGGIRGMMAFDRQSIEAAQAKGIARADPQGPQHDQRRGAPVDLGGRGQVRPRPEPALRAKW